MIQNLEEYTVEYNLETLEKIIKAKDGKRVFSGNGEEFGKWLQDIDKVVEEKNLLKYYKVDDSGEFIQYECYDYYPDGASFKYINGLFTLLDENAEKSIKGEL
jgi:hypothetical protein